MSESVVGKQIDYSAISLLEVSESTAPLERFKIYASSEHNYRRQYAVKYLESYLADLSRDELVEVFQHIERLKNDIDSNVRQTLAENIGIVSDIFAMTEPSDEPPQNWATTALVLSTIIGMMQDSIAQIRTASGSSLCKMSQKIGPHYTSTVIIPSVNALITSGSDDTKISAIETLGALIDSTTTEITKNHVFPIYMNISTITSHRILKAIISILPKVGLSLSLEERSSILIPLFQKWSKNSIWQVRKSCCEIAVEFSKLFQCDIINQEITPAILTMTEDNSRWVKNAVNDIIGPFILLFNNENVDKRLIDIFIQMPQSSNSRGGDPEGSYHCAFSFAAVLQLTGEESWPKLYPVFEALKRDIKFKVRRPLAFSLSLIGQVIGPNAAETDLLPTFEMFLMDLDDVKFGVIKTFADFVSTLNESGRESALHLLSKILTDSGLQWRSRSKIAKQVPKLCHVLSGAHLVHYALPTFFYLLGDSVGKVRQRASSAFPHVFLAVNEKAPDQMDRLLSSIIEFGSASQFTRRQSFVHMCIPFIQHVSTETIKKTILQTLLALTGDKVPNIRMTVCHALGNLAALPEFREDSLEVLRKLSQDVDSGVRTESTLVIQRLGSQIDSATEMQLSE